jgi:hypothetical protein
LQAATAMRSALGGGFAFILVAEGVLGRAWRDGEKFREALARAGGEVWAVGSGWTVRVALLAGDDPRAR